MTQTSVRITVYDMFPCPACEHSLPFLDRHNIPYTEVNILEDEAAARLVAAVCHGWWRTPLVEINGQFYTHPSDAELARILGVE